MVLLRAVGAAEYSGDIEAFCQTNGIRSKALREVRKLRVQLTNETNLILPTGTPPIVVDPRMPPPTEIQAKLLRQTLLAGLPDHVAKKISPQEIKEDEDRRKFKYAYRCPEMEDPVFLNPSSILRHSSPEWIVYQDIYEHDGKIYLRGITAIEPEWLPIFSPTQCTFSSPLEMPAPRFDSETSRVVCHMNVTFGRSGWPLPVMELEFPAGIDRFKYFAQFFLSGDVCPLLKRSVKLLKELTCFHVTSSNSFFTGLLVLFCRLLQRWLKHGRNYNPERKLYSMSLLVIMWTVLIRFWQPGRRISSIFCQVTNLGYLNRCMKKSPHCGRLYNWLLQ